jgi:uncharacterized protein (TIGR00266 family)
MEYEISCAPSFSVLEVSLDQGESIVAEAGAMSWMSPHVICKAQARGGILGSLKRAVLTGESFFQSTYTAAEEAGMVGLVPGAPGDIVPYEMRGTELILEKGAYLASTEGVKCDSKFDGLKGLFNEGMFVLRVTGEGLLFFNAYGDVEEVDVRGEYVVDNGYAVAWEPTLSYRVTRARKIRSFLFADQLLLRFQGHGKLWVQSRSPYGLANFCHPFRPQKSN